MWIKVQINENSFFFRNILSNVSRENMSRIFEQSSGFFSTTAYNVNELKILQNIVDTNRYSIRNIMDMVQGSCDDMFVRCRFEGKLINCSILFRPVTSQYGLCCTFNKNRLYKWDEIRSWMQNKWKLYK